jgi:GT2 family glycosyltransferase
VAAGSAIQFDIVEIMSFSIIIPTFNGASRIGNCLDALLPQAADANAEIIVVDDGSSDHTSDVVRRYPGVHLISQANSGPAAARNRGALEAKGTIILFTDDDCVPTTGWLSAMLKPFEDAAVVGVKGAYRTRQRALVARFVQFDYEDRYRLMANLPEIDFVDTYSAAFRRDRFLELKGYDMTFPLACAEDIELSYRMSERGWKMVFVPTAIVYHTHPDTLWRYLQKKYKFAYWRMLALRKNPKKTLKDSHTPQIMKLQLLFTPALLVAICVDLVIRPSVPASALVCIAFLLSTLPFTVRVIRKDPVVGLLSPFLLAARSCPQILGVASGVFYSWRAPSNEASESHA